ncbi:DUF2752 domain-containing protein [Lactobacillus delbrueckii subsp. bulgaricus]
MTAFPLLFILVQTNLPDEAVKKRAKAVFANGSIILAALSALLVSYHLTGHGLPCLFRALTGYLCPGCRMTRAAVAIWGEDFAKAWQYTPLSLTLLPVFAFYLLYIYKTGRYIRKGEEDFKLGESVFLLLIAICFAIARNL